MIALLLSASLGAQVAAVRQHLSKCALVAGVRPFTVLHSWVCCWEPSMVTCIVK